MQGDLLKIPPTIRSAKEQQDTLKPAEYISTPMSSRIQVFNILPKGLIYIFMHIHDPTTLNRKEQYRSIIFYSKGDKEEYEMIKQTLS